MPDEQSPTQSSNARSEPISRREFTRRAALAGASVAALPPAFLQASPTVRPASSPLPLPETQAPAGSKLSPESQAEVESKIQAIFGRYGDRLNPEQKADIRRLVGSFQESIEKVRSYALDNSVEPATLLQPLVESQKRRQAAPVPQKPKA